MPSVQQTPQELATPMTRAAAAANGGGAAGSPSDSGGADVAADGTPNGHANGHAHGHVNGHAERRSGGRQAADMKWQRPAAAAAAHAQTQPRSGSKRGRRQQPEEQLVAGREAVGRRLSVWWQRPQEWVEGRIKEFDAATGTANASQTASWPV